MKKIFKVNMSRGDAFLLEEEVVKKIMATDQQIVEIPLGKSTIFINKAHIVSIYKDVEQTIIENKQEAEENRKDDKIAPVSWEKIHELRTKAGLLAKKKTT